ncbi:MAG: hypothetical protein ACRDOO_01470, partial [Actinomadura sp.]
GYLLAGWLSQAGLRRQATKVTRYPSALVLGHSLIATVGLVAWALFLATARAMYAWSAFATLLIVVPMGFLMLTRWLVSRHGGRHARDGEQRFPAKAVVVHGAVAVATFVLVFLAAAS